MYFNEWFDLILRKKTPEQLVASKPVVGEAFKQYLVAMVIIAILGFITQYLLVGAIALEGTPIIGLVLGIQKGERPQPASHARGRDDRLEIWIHKELSEGVEYSVYSRLKKISCGFKDQARARHPGVRCGF